jgi:hypothetical protein
MVFYKLFSKLSQCKFFYNNDDGLFPLVFIHNLLGPKLVLIKGRVKIIGGATITPNFIKLPKRQCTGRPVLITAGLDCGPCRDRISTYHQMGIQSEAQSTPPINTVPSDTIELFVCVFH